MVRLYKVEGLSGSEIARRAGVTRNTVLGRMFRAGAMKGRHPLKQKDPPPKKTCRPPQAAAELSVFEGRPGVASVIALEGHHCRWPIGSGFCGHWRAGWVVTLAGDAGRALEARIGTANAAHLIYAASDPTRPLVDFYASGAEALRDMRARARS